MATRFTAASVNVVVHSGDANTQNARIHYDTTDTNGWAIVTGSGALDGTLSGATQLRRSVYDPVDKSTPDEARDSTVGVRYQYVAAQSRSVKYATGGATAARMVFVPAHL